MPEECRSCKGTGTAPPIEHDDGTVTPAAKCIQCDGAGNQSDRGEVAGVHVTEEVDAEPTHHPGEEWNDRDDDDVVAGPISRDNPIPFNPDTHFTTGEPMDIAWQLLKEEVNWDPSDYFTDAHTNPEKYAGMSHEEVKAKWEEAQARRQALQERADEHEKRVREQEEEERTQREAEAEEKRLHEESRPLVNPIKARMKELEHQHGLGSIEAVLDEERNKMMQAQIEERGHPKMIGSMSRDDIARIGENWENITAEDRQRLVTLPDHFHQAAEEHQANRDMIKDLMREGYVTQAPRPDQHAQLALWNEVQNEDSDINTGEPMDIAWRLLKASVGGTAGYPEDAPDWEDPLDREQKCPQCKGVGQFADGPFDGEGGTDYDYITCFTCGGSGSIEPTHHPGEQADGLRHDRTIFDIRDPGIGHRFDADNAMMAGNAVMTDDGVLQPKRLGYPICEHCKGKGEVDVSNTWNQVWSQCPECEGTGLPPAGMAQQRLTEDTGYEEKRQVTGPEIYGSTVVDSPEKPARPTNANIQFGSDPQGIFTTGEPMDIAMRLLKEEDDYGRSPRAEGGDGPDPNARWYAPDTFDADELRRYSRYLMDNFIDKLPEDAQGEVGFMLQFIEGAEKALRAGEEYFGFMTPEYAIGNINAILQKHGLTQDMGGMA